MGIDAVERAVRRVRLHVPAFQSHPPDGDVNPLAPANNHETSTRYLIIGPILRGLGWDLSDPNECVVEYRVATGLRGTGEGSGRADYALMDTRGDPAVLVEAKRIDVDTGEEENWWQVEDYLRRVKGVRAVVVTNGQNWIIELRTGQHGWRPESNRPLGTPRARRQEDDPAPSWVPGEVKLPVGSATGCQRARRTPWPIPPYVIPEIEGDYVRDAGARGSGSGYAVSRQWETWRQANECPRGLALVDTWADPTASQLRPGHGCSTLTQRAVAVLSRSGKPKGIEGNCA